MQYVKSSTKPVDCIMRLSAKRLSTRVPEGKSFQRQRPSTPIGTSQKRSSTMKRVTAADRTSSKSYQFTLTTADPNDIVRLLL